MNREYFCTQCGLYFWLDYREPRICSNPDCENHKIDDTRERLPVYACDTMGWAYFSRDNRNTIKEIGWSSPKYAHPSAIDIYKSMGVLIKE